MNGFANGFINNMQDFCTKIQEEQKTNEQWKNENRNDIIYNDFKNNLDKKRLCGEISASEYDKCLENLPDTISMWCPQFDKNAWQTAQEQKKQEETKQLLTRRDDTSYSMTNIDNVREQLNGTGVYMIVGNINDNQAKIVGDPQAVAALGGNVAFAGLTADQIAASNLSDKNKTALYGQQQGVLGTININSLRQNFTATASNGIQAGMSSLQNTISGETNYSDFANAQNIANNNYVIATGANEAAYYQNNNQGCNAAYMAIPCNCQPCQGGNINYMPCQMSVNDMMYASDSTNFQQSCELTCNKQSQNQQQLPTLPAWALQNNQHGYNRNYNRSNCKNNDYSGDNDSAGGFDNC